jgi:hypothetical protein
MKRIIIGIVCFLIFLLSAIAMSFGCAWSISQRAYLDRRFWQPFTHYVMQMVKHWRKQEPVLRPFAGYATSGQKSAPMAEARSAYDRLYQAYESTESEDEDSLLKSPLLNTARKVIEKSRNQTGLTADEQSELELLMVKVDLREGMVGNRERLLSARDGLRAFLQHAGNSPYLSEARGWLACAYYWLGEYSQAARIYMDEFKAADSNFDSGSLEISLRMVFDRAKPDLPAHIGEYFDKPEHALFVIQIVTNPMYKKRDPKLMRKNGAVILKEMERHRNLFAGENAEKLALAMMRVSLAMGDAARILQYASEIPSGSSTAQSADYKWITGCAHFLLHQFEAAEKPLQDLLKAPRTSLGAKGKAAMALIGVYSQLRCPLDKLDAALQWQKIRQRRKQADKELEKAYRKSQDQSWVEIESIWKRYALDENSWDDLNPLMPFAFSIFDLSILLDIELTVEQLQQYWDAHPDSDALVPYSLAVRLARREKYAEAAQLYAKVGARARQKRMLELQSLYDAAQSASQNSEEAMQKRFDYALFLSRHSCRIFFNDRLWDGFQTSSFLENEVGEGMAITDQQQAGLTKEERDQILRHQRLLQDEQEEYWRAYKMFDGIVKTASLPLAHRSAIEAVRCLDHIHSRFGRKDEIEAETSRLIRWLNSHRAA